MANGQRVLGVLALFSEREALLRAAEKVRDAGWRRWDCHTPHPVHGLSRAMGLSRSFMPLIAIPAAFFGAAAGKLMQWWMSAWDFPLIIGGTPLFALPAFAPVAFETFVLCAALSTFAALLLVTKLFRWHSPLHDAGLMRRVTSDRYALWLDASDTRFDEATARQILLDCGGEEVQAVEEARAADGEMNFAPPPRWVSLWKAALMGVAAFGLLFPWTIHMGWLRVPTPMFFNGMATQAKAKQQAQNPFLPGGVVMQAPVAGTVPQGVAPYSYAYPYPFPNDPERAGKELVNPLSREMPNLMRGEHVFNTFCIPCHGYKGMGDGAATGLGRLAAPPSLHSKKVTEWPDGRIYHNITMGQNNKMPSYADQIVPQDRWAATLYVRVLQRALAPKAGDLPTTGTLTGSTNQSTTGTQTGAQGPSTTGTATAPASQGSSSTGTATVPASQGSSSTGTATAPASQGSSSTGTATVPASQDLPSTETATLLPRRGCITKPRVAEVREREVVFRAPVRGYPGLACPRLLNPERVPQDEEQPAVDRVQPLRGWDTLWCEPRVASVECAKTASRTPPRQPWALLCNPFGVM